MTRRLSALFNATVFFVMMIIPGFVSAQADPVWLKQWNKAQSVRPDVIESEARIAPEDEPGDAMVLSGQVVNPDGSPATDLLVHAYHRDHDGFDFGPGDAETSTWRLQGWARTGKDGRFRFHTIRPAVDHLGREAAHIHVTLVSDQYGRQWAPKIYFADDPRVTDRERQHSAQAGEYGRVREVSHVNGVQTVQVRFRLKPDADF